MDFEGFFLFFDTPFPEHIFSKVLSITFPPFFLYMAWLAYSRKDYFIN